MIAVVIEGVGALRLVRDVGGNSANKRQLAAVNQHGLGRYVSWAIRGDESRISLVRKHEELHVASASSDGKFGKRTLLAAERWESVLIASQELHASSRIAGNKPTERRSGKSEQDQIEINRDSKTD
eukprot:6182582-Pleurochrysis_carterae.AAC.1